MDAKWNLFDTARPVTHRGLKGSLCVPVHNAASLLDASKCFTRLLLNSSTHGKDARLFTGREEKKKKEKQVHRMSEFYLKLAGYSLEIGI